MTQRFSKSVFVASVFAAAVTVAFAQQNVGQLDKHAMYAQMRDIARQIETLSAMGADPSKLDDLRVEYASLSELMGGDDPANINRQANTVLAPNLNGPQSIVTPICAGSTATTTNFPGATGPIPDAGNAPGVLSVTAAVSGVGTYLQDINVNTTITHTENADLDITLTSPGGTTVTLTTDNGGTNDNVFNGTVWDDSINDTTADHVYANLVVATPLNAEGRLAAFRGENPNGTWTLTIRDDTATDVGALSAFSLDITTAVAPVEATNTFSDTPAIAIATGAGASYPDTQAVSGVGTVLTGLKLYIEITHTWTGDLDITLTPPTGPAIKVFTDIGGSTDNNLNGTTFDPDSTIVATDLVFTNLVVVPLAAPEGSFDNWLGLDPNGVWTLDVTDDATGDGGVFNRWDLIVTTTTTPLVAAGPTNHVGGTGAIPDAGPLPPTQFACVVSGVGTSLWDVDANVNITHTFNADLDITLTSAAGTVVAVSTDNGSLNDNVFAGTLFDDDANDPVTDHVYVNLTVATPLSPEGRFSAFRGENPNGTWNLTIVDDLGADVGNVNSFSLDITTIAPVPSSNSNTYSDSPALAILDLATVSDTQAVSGAGTSITEVVLYTEITHTQNDELDITLTSPAGTVVVVTTDNGSSNDNVFNGTTFDPDSTTAVTDIVTVNNVVIVVCSPEGSFDNFGGEDPNGNWTLTITDDTSTDTGTLVRWDLTIATCASAVTVVDCQILPTVTQTCQSAASATGTPSATAGSGFTTTFSSLNAQVNGVVFYGTNGPNSAPWSAQSNLCVKSPTVRLGGVTGASGNTGGTIGLCNGQYSFDFNAVILAAGIPATTTVIAQGWQRDPASAKTTNLTDALSFVVGP